MLPSSFVVLKRRRFGPRGLYMPLGKKKMFVSSPTLKRFFWRRRREQKVTVLKCHKSNGCIVFLAAARRNAFHLGRFTPRKAETRFPSEVVWSLRTQLHSTPVLNVKILGVFNPHTWHWQLQGSSNSLKFNLFPRMFHNIHSVQCTVKQAAGCAAVF